MDGPGCLQASAKPNELLAEKRRLFQEEIHLQCSGDGSDSIFSSQKWLFHVYKLDLPPTQWQSQPGLLHVE